MSDVSERAEAWIVVDPVQDWEESLKILGVYGSEDEARQGLLTVRDRLGKYDRNGWLEDGDCYLNIQHWRGDEMVDEMQVPG
jgi:hypothetical protein